MPKSFLDLALNSHSTFLYEELFQSTKNTIYYQRFVIESELDECQKRRTLLKKLSFRKFSSYGGAQCVCLHAVQRMYFNAFYYELGKPLLRIKI